MPPSHRTDSNPLHPAAGFSLIELLVVLVLLGFITALVGQALRLGWQSRTAALRVEAAITEQETTMRALRQLIVSASPGDPAIQGGALVGTAHAVSFVTTLPQGFGAPATGEAEVTLAVGRTQALELLWRPHYRRWIAAPLPPVPYVLLTHVARLDLSFLGTSGSGWTSSWSARELPRLVRLHVVFTDGDTRHWPDLIVAPMRQVPPS